MSLGRTKSRTLRRISTKTPGGKVVTHYEQKRPPRAVCADCGKALSGVPRERPKKLASLPKSKRNPQRPFGGVLCSSCSRKRIKISL